jgi:hypothetical protein
MSVILLPVHLVSNIPPRTRNIVPVIVRHDTGVHEIALREDLLAHGTESRCLAGGVIAAQDAWAIPVLANTHGDAIWLHSCSERLELVDEIIAVVLISNGFSTELDAVKGIGCNVGVSAAGEDFED